MGTSARSLRYIWSKMPKRCVLWNCNNVVDKTKTSQFHVIPFYGDDRPIAKSRRKQWVDFVRTHLFVSDYYTRRFDYDGVVERSRLIRDEIWVLASTDGRNSNGRRWNYVNRTCKAKGLYRHLTAASVLFTLIRKMCA